MSYIKINDTKVYKLAFDFLMKLFSVTHKFLKEATYLLTDEMKCSGRSVCTWLAMAHKKRLYPAHFILKIAGADIENLEAKTWLEFGLAFNYTGKKQHDVFL